MRLIIHSDSLASLPLLLDEGRESLFYCHVKENVNVRDKDISFSHNRCGEWM